MAERRPGWAWVEAWVTVSDELCVRIAAHNNTIVEAHESLTVVGLPIKEFYSLASERGWKIRRSNVE